MAEKVKFQYFQGEEAEQYTFYRIPKQLFTIEYFKSLSSDAKILYGLMLDRMSLSIKNNWFDNQNRAYIYFSIEDIVEFLGCGKNKAVKLMKELDTGTGIGLIEKRRQGFGKANIIYVKKFMVEMPAENSRKQTLEKILKPEESCQKQTSVKIEKALNYTGEMEQQKAISNNPEEKTENVSENKQDLKAEDREEGDFDEIIFSESPRKKFENQTTGVIDAFTESRKANFMNPQNQQSRIPDNKLLEVCFEDPNNTYKSNTEYSYNKSNLISSSGDINLAAHNDEMRYDPNPPLLSRHLLSGEEDIIIDRNEKIEAYKKVIRQNIDYDFLLSDPTTDHKIVQEIYELIVETVLCLGEEIVVASNCYPVEIVRSRFMKLNYMHIRYVLECLEKNNTKVKNIRKYLLATLFNAPATMDGYYRAEVKHDLHCFARYGEE